MELGTPNLPLLLVWVGGRKQLFQKSVLEFARAGSKKVEVRLGEAEGEGRHGGGEMRGDEGGVDSG
jgi:hypothetical protein